MSDENLWTSFERSCLHGLWKTHQYYNFLPRTTSQPNRWTNTHQWSYMYPKYNVHWCTPKQNSVSFFILTKGLIFRPMNTYIHCKISPKAKLEYSIEWKEKAFCFHNGTVNRFRDFGSFTFWSIYLYPTGWKICCLFFKQKTETAEFEIVRKKKKNFLTNK